MKLTTDQRSKIFALQRQQGMSKSDLYAVVAQISGGDSISALSKEQAIRLIDRLEHLGGKPLPQPREHRATDAMLGKIRQLEQVLGWADEPKRLQGFIKKLTGVERASWLTKKQGAIVIEAMKKMYERGYQREMGNDKTK